MKDMAAHVKGARFYGWDQKSEIVKEISKRPMHQPVILVGHSLGGDTAVEIANELNTLEHSFRKVNLLATLDSFGFNNDIIPQNVERNLNFIGHKSLWLNDGPNIARNTHETEVINELRDEQHTELDDSEQIQYNILKEINQLLAKNSKHSSKEQVG
jgi:thioesterase domain-containing protein